VFPVRYGLNTYYLDELRAFLKVEVSQLRVERQTNMVTGPTEPGTKNVCAGEGQQQCTRNRSCLNYATRMNWTINASVHSDLKIDQIHEFIRRLANRMYMSDVWHSWRRRYNTQGNVMQRQIKKPKFLVLAPTPAKLLITRETPYMSPTVFGGGGGASVYRIVRISDIQRWGSSSVSISGLIHPSGNINSQSVGSIK
jgi:hypothetical protein